MHLHRSIGIGWLATLVCSVAGGAEPSRLAIPFNPSRPVTVAVEVRTPTEAQAKQFMQLAVDQGFPGTTFTVNETSGRPRTWTINISRTSIVSPAVLSEQLAALVQAGSSQGATLSYKVGQSLP